MDIKDFNDIELQQEERIISFFQGKMTAEEEATFKNDLQKDPAFKKNAISLAHLAKGLSQVGSENDKLLKEAFLSSDELTISKIAKQAIKGNQATTKKVIPFKKFATILSIAASLLFIVYFGFRYNDYRNTLALGDQYAKTFENSVARGGGNSNASKEVEMLVNNVYNKKDLSATLKRLAVLWELSTMDTYNDYIDYAPQIGWALATGYLKDNNKIDASIVLEKMSKLYDEDDSMGKLTRELQVKIKEL